MRMIKLTNASGKAIYVNVKHLIAFGHKMTG